MLTVTPPGSFPYLTLCEGYAQEAQGRLHGQHPDTGKKLTGHYCLVCRYILILGLNAFYNMLLRDKGVRQIAYFFAGGISTLHIHITRYDTSLFH